MSVRTCVWPDCPSRFPIDQGPSTQGWRLIQHFVFCPFHSEPEHAPAVLHRTSRGRAAKFGCLCLDWESRLVQNTLQGVQEWQAHVRVALRGAG